ncbi:phosphatidylinositol 3 and 4-kinase-domain-containing protein [Halteromyces radiatus]|uniref:phosphatidylinositol 3 and 4-kinase-domain-containing protein n=1 Tax=Halteromyces radiatus TaxID=101107 RepID=UPI0022201337|nr:phosphatidylinositol 3 and 4-kinase-domain-containing protein [Halteromyces radiatus]KAI8081433.1 phosphatidylinositol 3 and 4-kinase-domain-containing protein [Halteromyces radiatus]
MIPQHQAQGPSLSHPSNTNSSSFLPNDSLAKLPQATRDYFHNKWLPTKASKATLANMPPVILSDIQQGNIPSHTDPTLRELDVRGWTIVHRRRYRLKKPKKKKKSRKNTNIGSAMHVSTTSAGGDTTDDDIHDPFLDSSPLQPKDQYLQIVESVQLAINDNIQPTRISQGSSGSYFCRDRDNTIVGVFKPKNEEPYGQLNPKWAKWIHRHLFPCCFGRSCLIPNLGYISEAAASLVDQELGTCIVPSTNLDHFTSPSFHYDYLDRRRYRLSPQQHPLPLKIGSFQCFLHGYRDANVFLRDNPWPLETSSSLSLDYVALNMGSDGGGGSSNSSGDENDSDTLRNRTTFYGNKIQKPTFQWTPQLQSQFKKEFERLVILDYLIRNTDRGLDNWMIRYCEGGTTRGHLKNASSSNNSSSNTSIIIDHHHEERTGKTSCKHGNTAAHIHIAAIDNGLAFPFKHPDEWRSYPYGWLALPSSLVARPFSKSTRRKFLPILSDPVWWRNTVERLRQLFQVDPDFNERMFQRQMAVFRGQGYNLARALKDSHAGPLDLVAMERILVQQEEVFIEYDEKRLEERLPRLRPKRSTSFNAYDGSSSNSPSILSPSSSATHRSNKKSLPWKDRVRKRLSLDLGRGRLTLRHIGSDGEMMEDDYLSIDSLDDQQEPVRKRVLFVMETIKLVKSKLPYFTCC